MAVPHMLRDGFLDPKSKIFEKVDSPTQGYVYILWANDSTRYKVGNTNFPKKRLGDLQTGNPEKLHLLRVFRVFDRQKAEKILKAVMGKEGKFVLGEWYNIPSHDIQRVLGVIDGRINADPDDVYKAIAIIPQSEVEGLQDTIATRSKTKAAKEKTMAALDQAEKDKDNKSHAVNQLEDVFENLSINKKPDVKPEGAEGRPYEGDNQVAASAEVTQDAAGIGGTDYRGQRDTLSTHDSEEHEAESSTGEDKVFAINSSPQPRLWEGGGGGPKYLCLMKQIDDNQNRTLTRFAISIHPEKRAEQITYEEDGYKWECERSVELDDAKGVKNGILKKLDDLRIVIEGKPSIYLEAVTEADMNKIYDAVDDLAVYH